ncbi:MAG: hypothetical protein IPK32_21475 [Verrucomicrobiaceae bacterium]|nr:hypothetical protein [Verrucomicrobiaceae bacterium]
MTARLAAIGTVFGKTGLFPGGRAFAQNALSASKRRKRPNRHPLSVVAPETKNWPLDRWMALADKMGDLEVIFITGEAGRGMRITGSNRIGIHCR